MNTSAGLAFVRTIRESLPGLKIVLIGMELDSELFLRAVREGVAGYLLKDATAADVAAAVRSVANDRAICPPELCQALFDYVAQQRTSFPSFADQAAAWTYTSRTATGGNDRPWFTNKEIAGAWAYQSKR